MNDKTQYLYVGRFSLIMAIIFLSRNIYDIYINSGDLSNYNIGMFMISMMFLQMGLYSFLEMNKYE